jgi:hypothetical protein
MCFELLVPKFEISEKKFQNKSDFYQMSAHTTAVMVVLIFAGLQQGHGQKDSVENWRLSLNKRLLHCLLNFDLLYYLVLH